MRYYNNWDFDVLGTIYEHATGTCIFEALYRKVAKPIGMQDYRPHDGEYFRGDASIHPAYPIRMSARDGTRLEEGPCRLRFEPGVTYLRSDPRCGPTTGTWMVSEGQLCIRNVERRCFIPVVNGDRIELFDRYGVMQINTVALPQ